MSDDVQPKRGSFPPCLFSVCTHQNSYLCHYNYYIDKTSCNYNILYWLFGITKSVLSEHNDMNYRSTNQL